MLKKIQALVKSQSHLVLATCGPEGPHASLMAFAASPDASEFWLATLAGTRKFRNLQANPRASLLVDDRTASRGGGGPGLALTVEARLVPFATEAAGRAARAALLALHPNLAAFVDLEGAELLRLRTLRWQLLAGLTEVYRLEAEKIA